jgi:hypothetical protein
VTGVKGSGDLELSATDLVSGDMGNRGLAMTFGEAIEALKVGKKVQRDGWNGKGMWLGLQRPDAHSKMGLPYIYMSTVDGKLVPWFASQPDMLSEDWSILGEKT